MNILPILNFHGFKKTEDKPSQIEEEIPYEVDLKIFHEILEWLNQRNFMPLNSKQISEWFNHQDRIEKPMVLTFDDGLMSQWEWALPVLDQFQYKGLFFIPAGLVGSPHSMDWSELQALIHGGHEIGSHGFNHVALTALSEAELDFEISSSKKLLEDKLGRKINTFSVPRGFLNDRVHQKIQEAGYEFIFTSRFDLNARSQSPLFLNRIAVKRTHDLKNILKWITGNLGIKKYFERVKEEGRSFLSPEFYDYLALLKRRVL